MANPDINEEWRPVEDWPYEVSSLGRVRRVGAEILTPFDNTPNKKWAGYLSVNLSDGECRRRRFFVARLVCRAFHGEPISCQHEVAHWDGNKANNQHTNLRWVTSKENKDDNKRLGVSISGKRRPGVKFTDEQIKEIRGAKLTQYQIADLYGVSQALINRIKLKTAYAHVLD